MRIKARRLAVIAVIAALSTTLAACGGSTAPSGPASTSPEAAAHNAADTEFAQMMIVHHLGAVEMAELALEKATDEVRPLADRIVRAQGPEIDLMSGWLESWGEALPEMDAHDGMDHGGMDMEGMGQAEAMGQLERLSGTEFDRRFLQLMTAHHQGAVEMAQQVHDDGESTAVRELATTIIKDQEAEIGTMHALLQRL